MKDLRLLFVSRASGSRPVFVSAPGRSDTDPSLAIYFDHGWDFGSGTYYHPDEVLTLVGKTWDDVPEMGAEAEKAIAEETAPTLDPTVVETWAKTLTDVHSPRYQRMQWLRDRGLTRDTIRKARLGHTGRYFTIPIFSRERQVIGVRFRRDDEYCSEADPRYLQPRGQPVMIYYPPLPDLRGKAVICEGELDALLLAQYGVNAVTTTGGSGTLANKFRGAFRGVDVVVATDQDEAGEKAHLDLRMTLSARSVTRLRFEAKDVTDALRGKTHPEVVETLHRWFR